MTRADVIVGQQTYNFKLVSGVYQNIRGDGATLIYDSSGPYYYVFTSHDGEVTGFSSTACSYVATCFLQLRRRAATGQNYIISTISPVIFTAVNSCRSTDCGGLSIGYGFEFAYLDEGSTGLTNQSRLTVGSIAGTKTTCPASPTIYSSTTLSAASHSHDNVNGNGKQLISVNASCVSRTFTYDTTTEQLRSAFQSAYPTTPNSSSNMDRCFGATAICH